MLLLIWSVFYSISTGSSPFNADFYSLDKQEKSRHSLLKSQKGRYSSGFHKTQRIKHTVKYG